MMAAPPPARDEYVANQDAGGNFTVTQEPQVSQGNQQPQYQPPPQPPPPLLLPNEPMQYPPSPPQQQQHSEATFQPSFTVNSKDATIMGDDSFAFKTPESSLSAVIRSLRQRWQLFLDAVTPHIAARWSFSITMLIIFLLRVVLSHKWYVICYALGIYYLNLFLAFISPRIDPAFQASGLDEFGDDEFGQDSSDTGPMLPTRANDEFKPFIRRLPEFKFWLAGTNATLISLLLTIFDLFDMPVYWPILLLYFIVLTISTLRQQIKHMIKYGYVPWDKGKRRYGRQNEEPARLFPTTV